MDAGYTMEGLRGQNTGVYVGSSATTPASGSLERKSISVYDATSESLSIAAGRISYALGLEGPAMTVDTACLSALVGLHTAKLALARGECSMAVVSKE